MKNSSKILNPEELMERNFLLSIRSYKVKKQAGG